MRLPLLLALGWFCLAGPSAAATLDGLAVDVTNASEPILCAEKDNVAINFASPEVRNFKIEAVHPAYIGNMRQDRWEPDWTACDDISEASSNHTQPRMQVLYEDAGLRVTGLSFHAFWRPSDVVVRVGDRVEHDIHLMQVLVRREDRFEEVAVLYPGDGYWRIHPLAPDHLGFVAYGSSFLIGPVEVDQRPVVNLTDVAFDPKTMSFELAFKDGNHGRVVFENLSAERLRLDVTFDRPVTDRPFAVLRSMYVTEFNADVARVAAREAGARSWREEPVMNFRDARATDVWLGRLVPSRHNTSAPDMMFNDFRAEPAPRR
ncbi:MAG: hypothetical protein ABW026_02660 [Microvirga sp.]